MLLFRGSGSCFDSPGPGKGHMRISHEYKQVLRSDDGACATPPCVHGSRDAVEPSDKDLSTGILDGAITGKT